MDKDKLAERVERLFEEHKAYLEFINGEIEEIRISRPELVFDLEETNKDNVITELLRRIATLEYEVERQDNILEEVNNYVEKMSYSSIVDNPKKDLQKILKKENKND